jgi:hypothetical protein
MLEGDAAVLGRRAAASTARDKRGAVADRIAKATIEARTPADRRKRPPIASDDLFGGEDAVKPPFPPANLWNSSAVWPNALTRADFRAFHPSDSLHPPVKSTSVFSDGHLSDGKARVSGEDESKRLVGCFADADARGDLDTFYAEAIFADPQTGRGQGEIASVVACAGDAEGFGEASRTAGQAGKMTRAGRRDSPGACHFLHAQERFERAK